MGRFCKNEVLPPPFRGLLRGILCCPALLFAIACAAYDFSDVSSGATLYYSILSETDSVEVVAADITSDYTEIVIPDSVKYKPSEDVEEKTYYVKSIAAAAFAGNTTLTKITIPETVTTIDEKAFADCSALETVVFNAKQCGSAKNIFAGCNAISSLTFGENVTVIPDNFLSSVSSDDDYYGTSKSDTLKVTNFPKLTTITIPNSVIYVGTYAFTMNAGLETLTIGTGVLYIRQDAFADCPNLATVNYNATACSSDGYHGNTMNYCAFWNDTNLSSFVIASGVQSIPDFLLYGEYSHGFPYLTTLTIPSSVTSIGEKAFAYCTSLATLTLEDGTETLAITTSSSATAFSNCPIATLYLGRDITYTGEYSPFRGNTSLTSLTIGDKVTSIGYYGFYGCTGLTEVVIPNNITSVGEHALEYCSGLVTLTIGSGVGLIGGNAFANNTNLKAVYYNAADCSAGGWFTDGATVPWSCIFYGDLILENFYFGNTVTNIPKYLVNGEYSSYYPKLKTVTIPSSVQTIGTHAFHYTSLETVICESSTPATCDANSFASMQASSTWLVVPEDAAINYGGTFQATVPTETGWNVLDNLREVSVTLAPTASNDYYTTCYSPYEYTLQPGVKGAVIKGLDSTQDDDETYEDQDAKVFGLTISWDYNGDNDGNNVVPAGTALLILGSSETSYVNETKNTSAAKVTGNYLYGTTTTVEETDNAKVMATTGSEENDANYYFYRFTYGASTDFQNVLGFYWMNTDGGPFELSAKKAWLAVPKSEIGDDEENIANAANLPLMNFNEMDGSDFGTDPADNSETTGISVETTGGNGEKVIYNLQGVRVSNMSRPGIYIVDGKKCVKK